LIIVLQWAFIFGLAAFNEYAFGVLVTTQVLEAVEVLTFTKDVMAVRDRRSWKR
jgi:hypothetical protein